MLATDRDRSSNGRRLLFIAFHFPPIQGSTGVTRTLAFARYLRDCGWEVAVLTANPRAYPEIRIENLATIPEYVRVERAFALDTRRHLSIAGRFPLALATPDRWQSWIVGGFVRARSLVRSWRPSVIMSTYPIASAHHLGHWVHQWSGLPWVADFRDPMVQEGYPPEQMLHRAYQRIEKKVFGGAARIIVTTEGTAELYRNRFPQYPHDSVVVIPNGFDEALFPNSSDPPQIKPLGRPVLLHSGVMYPSERDPTALFHALAEIRDEGRLAPHDLEIRLRATGYDQIYAPQTRSLKIDDFVRLEPAIPYKDALREMSTVDACMVLQASNCNFQVPAKVYEYLYSGAPIIGFTDPAGDTAKLLSSFGIADIAPLHDKAAIKRTLLSFLSRLQTRRIATPDRNLVMSYSRRELTKQLGRVLDEVSAT